MNENDNGHQPDPTTEEEYLESLSVEPENEPEDIEEEDE